MFLERKQDLSIYYWLEDLFSSYSIVTINDGYPDGDLQRPSVTIEAEPIDILPYEMGSRTGRRIRIWSIDVIALNKAQRDEFISLILNDIESGIPVYDYDEGFPPDNSPTQIGLLRPQDIRAIPVRIFPELVEKMYWRSTIRFSSEYNEF